MVDGGTWAKKDVFYFTAIHTSNNGEALVNWKNPGTHDLTIVLDGGTMNFTPYEGFQSDDGAYIDTNYNPATQGASYKLEDASYGVASYINSDVYGGALIGARKAGTILSVLFTEATSDVAIFYINDDLTTSKPTNTDKKGIYIATKTIFDKRLYKNKTSIYDTPKAGVEVPNFNFYLLAYNNQNTVTSKSTETISWAMAGAYFNQTEVNTITDAVNAAMAAKGKVFF